MDCAKIVNDAVRMGDKNGFKLDREMLDNLKCVAKELESPVVPQKSENIAEAAKKIEPAQVKEVTATQVVGKRSPRKR